MRRGNHPFNWLYLVQPEDSTTQARCFAAETAKTVLWIGISFLMSVGLSQLT